MPSNRIMQVNVLVHCEDDGSSEWFTVQTPDGWEQVVIGRNAPALLPKHNTSDSVRMKPLPKGEGQGVAVATRVTAPQICVHKGGIWICS